jgi:hypothetical protein
LKHLLNLLASIVIQLFSIRLKANSTKAKQIKVEGFYQFFLHGKEIKAGKRIKTAAN